MDPEIVRLRPINGVQEGAEVLGCVARPALAHPSGRVSASTGPRQTVPHDPRRSDELVALNTAFDALLEFHQRTGRLPGASPRAAFATPPPVYGFAHCPA